jgi:hypothetical protein
VKPTFEQVYKTFGPTHPGKFDDAHDTYELVYPGLVLAFNVTNVKKKSITGTVSWCFFGSVADVRSL